MGLREMVGKLKRVILRPDDEVFKLNALKLSVPPITIFCVYMEWTSLAFALLWFNAMLFWFSEELCERARRIAGMFPRREFYLPENDATVAELLKLGIIEPAPLDGVDEDRKRYAAYHLAPRVAKTFESEWHFAGIPVKAD